MRVADSTFFDRMRAALGTRSAALAEAQQHATSGLRAAVPSDDPLAVSLARREHAAEHRFAAHIRSAQEATGLLNVADNTLGDVHDALLFARDLTLQAANDTLTPADRSIILGQITQLRDQVLSLANTEQAGRFVFAGYLDNAAAFDPAGQYVGDSAARAVEVLPGVSLPVGLTGDQIFAPTGGVDIFAAFTNLQTALGTGDAAGLQLAIDAFNTGAQQVANARADVGTLMQTAEMAQSVAERSHDRAIERRSSLIEVDAAVAYTELSRAQTALDAAVGIAGQLPPPGLASSRR
jgi:flagellar hook-associated protein 3 FlgL